MAIVDLAGFEAIRLLLQLLLLPAVVAYAAPPFLPTGFPLSILGVRLPNAPACLQATVVVTIPS